MAGLGLILDPTSEDAANTQIDVNDGATFAIIDEPDFAPPDLDPQYASSSDTEGSIPASNRHQNRRIVVPVRVYGLTASGLDTQIAKLQQKTGKVVRDGGTLKLTAPSGKTAVYDLLDASFSVSLRKRLVSNFIAETVLTFTAKPYGRLAPQTFSLSSENTNPALVFEIDPVPGDVPALGSLEISEGQGIDQWLVVYGLQSRVGTSSSVEMLFRQAEDLTPQGGAATTGAVLGASGGSCVRHLALGTNYVSILSTQLTGGGSHQAHVGDFQVFARFWAAATNTGDVTVAFEWAQGDLRAPTRNDPVTLTQDMAAAANGDWWLADLGSVHLTKALVGTQQWEGRVLAKGERLNDKIAVDYLLFVPLEASGQLRGVPPTAAPTTFTARDEFDQAAGVLTGKTAAVGGTWTAGGGAGDFSVVTATKTADRTQVSDALARRALLTNGALTDMVAQVDFKATSMPSGQLWTGGLVLRHDTASGRHLRVYAQSFNGVVSFDHYTNDTNSAPGAISGHVGVFTADTWYTLRALVDSRGRLFVWFGPRDAGLSLVLQAYDSRLATGGSWASGDAYGFFDLKLDASAQTRSFDNFYAAPVARDAALFAARKARIRHDAVLREDAGGTVWAPASRFEGDYLRVPPGKSRVIVKACRNPPETMPDVAIDDINAQLTVIPRTLALPE